MSFYHQQNKDDDADIGLKRQKSYDDIFKSSNDVSDTMKRFADVQAGFSNDGSVVVRPGCSNDIDLSIRPGCSNDVSVRPSCSNDVSVQPGCSSDVHNRPGCPETVAGSAGVGKSNLATP